MSITKEFLENLGITGEAADAIFAERGKEITEVNKKIESLTSENAKLNENINNISAEKDKLSKDAVDSSAIQKQFDDYKAEIAAMLSKRDAEAADKELTSKIESVFGDKKFTSDYARVGLINDIKSQYNKEGNTSSLSEISDSLTKDKTGIFESQHKKVVIPSSGANSDSDDELQKIRQNMLFPSAMNNNNKK